MRKKITVGKKKKNKKKIYLLANKSSSNKQTKKIIMSAMRYSLTYASGTPIWFSITDAFIPEVLGNTQRIYCSGSGSI